MMMMKMKNVYEKCKMWTLLEAKGLLKRYLGVKKHF